MEPKAGAQISKRAFIQSSVISFLGIAVAINFGPF